MIKRQKRRKLAAVIVTKWLCYLRRTIDRTFAVWMRSWEVARALHATAGPGENTAVPLWVPVVFQVNVCALVEDLRVRSEA